LDPVTGRVVVHDSPSMPGATQGLGLDAHGRPVTLSGGMAGSPAGSQHQHQAMRTRGHTEEAAAGSLYGAAAGQGSPSAGSLYGAVPRRGSPPAGMGHGHPPGHQAVFAPGAPHGPAVLYDSYAPAVGPGSANGSASSGIQIVNPYTGAAMAGGMGMGMIAAGAAAAAAGVGGVATPGSGTIPAAIPGRFRQQHADSDVSSMFSNASSVGEPLQPQRLPPFTWPAEAVPSPTASSMHSVFQQHDSMMMGGISGYSTEALHGDIQGYPRAPPARPAALEASEGGGDRDRDTGGPSTVALGAAGAVAAGAAALAGGAAVGAMKHQQQRDEQQQVAEGPGERPEISVKLDAAAAAGSGAGSPRRRSKSKAAAAAAAAQEEREQEQRTKSSGGSDRRKSGLGGLFGECFFWPLLTIRPSVVKMQLHV
jgi:hypothetical protein